MANGGGEHEAPWWKILPAIASFASVAWGVVKSLREHRPTVGVVPKRTTESDILDRLAMLEEWHTELRREVADDRQTVERRYQQIFDLLLQIRSGEIGN